MIKFSFWSTFRLHPGGISVVASSWTIIDGSLILKPGGRVDLWKILVLLGSTAMNSLVGDETVISNVRGKWIEKQFGKCKTSLIVTFHPAFLMRQPTQKKMAWIDLKMIKEKKLQLKI